MKPSENIEKLIKKTDIDTNAKMDEVLLSEVLKAFEKSKNKKPMSSPQNIWRTIMKSRIPKLAATVVIMIAVIIGVRQFGSSIDLSSVALAQMTKAIKKMPWMHVRAEIDAPGSKGQINSWICFEKSIEITKQVDGTIRYRDEGRDTMYVYEPISNTVIITSLSDRYAVERRTPFPLSPMEGIERLIETLREEGKAELSIDHDEINGQSVEIIHAATLYRIQDESIINQDMTIIINAGSKLPIHMDTVATKENGVRLGTAHADFDYPNEGPENIYSLGVPQDAEVVDRRPRPDVDSEININYRFVTNPENHTQEMLILYGGINIDLVKIPEGEFLMGSPDTEIGYPARFLEMFGEGIKRKGGSFRPDNESPQHLVKIARGFYMSKYEITCSQFRKFRPEFRKKPYRVGTLSKSKSMDMDMDNQPASVSLNDATEFCKWLSEKTGLNVRLPSEAEWEYGCRAGTQSRFYWGDSEEEAGKYANLADKAYEKVAPGNLYTLNTDDGNVGLAPVGHYLPNNFGLYDMIGNTTEWVQGVYSENAYSIDPNNMSFDLNKEENQELYIKGGSWKGEVTHSRCASRWQVSQDAVSNTLRSYTGFRIIIDEP